MDFKTKKQWYQNVQFVEKNGVLTHAHFVNTNFHVNAKLETQKKEEEKQLRENLEQNLIHMLLHKGHLAGRIFGTIPNQED